MSKYCVPEIAQGVYAVGVKDWSRRIFDALIPLPEGTTYNAYLVKGAEKTALVDAVNPGFEDELLGRIAEVADPESIDYVVMNHAEPDHAGAIPQVLERNPRATVVASSKGVGMAQRRLGISASRLQAVTDGDTVDLGGRTLRFLEAPMLHWPETMFTYVPESAALLPCDFFGAHVTMGRFDEDVEELIGPAKRYFGEIMLPFRKMGVKALAKLEPLDLQVIGPSHGPVYRNPERILAPYRKWTAGQTEPKVLVVYVSMYGSTERYVKALANLIEARGMQAVMHDVCVADLGDLACELVDARGLVLGTPTVLNGMHPLVHGAANLVAALRPPLKHAALVTSYGWSRGALKQATQLMESAKIEVVGSLESDGSEPVDAPLCELADQLVAALGD